MGTSHSESTDSNMELAPSCRSSIFPGKALYEILECLCEFLLIHPEEHLRSDTNVRQDSLALIIH